VWSPKSVVDDALADVSVPTAESEEAVFNSGELDPDVDIDDDGFPWMLALQARATLLRRDANHDYEAAVLAIMAARRTAERLRDADTAVRFFRKVRATTKARARARALALVVHMVAGEVR
jgi:hypothetical protein